MNVYINIYKNTSINQMKEEEKNIYRIHKIQNSIKRALQKERHILASRGVCVSDLLI